VSLSVAQEAGGAADWDAFVRAAEGWTHFHLAGWRSVMEEALGHQCPYLAARDSEGRLVGVLPLVRVKSLLFGHYLVSMPFLNYGGPLGSGDAVRALVEHAVGLARQDGARLLELRSRRPLALDLPVSQRKITVVLDVPSRDPDVLFKAFPSKLRSQVRRPGKEGVAVRFGRDQLEAFYTVFARHMRDLGTPVMPRRFFERAADVFGDDVWIGCAWLDGAPVAAGWGFRWGGEVEVTWAAALGAYHRVAPNMALYWAFMERAALEGCTMFNFGRCTPGSGTHRFKQQWGSRDEPLYWYQHASAGRPARTPSPDDAAWSWGPRLWRRLPLALANRLGPPIVRCIP
jgi:FemAB-related protein (PEP-CTERM system-associated)